MEDLAPIHNFLVSIISSLEGRNSLRQSIKQFLQMNNDKNSNKDLKVFTKEVSIWFIQFEQNNVMQVNKFFSETPYRLGLLRLLIRGLQGQSIYQFLVALEKEVYNASVDQIESNLKIQPLKLLVPLLFFQFPAFLLLLFGPIIQQFIESFSF